MDEGDYGQDYQARLNAAALTEHRNKNHTPHREEVSECQGCGEEIPEARRQARPGCTLCVACQTMKEGRSCAIPGAHDIRPSLAVTFPERRG